MRSNCPCTDPKAAAVGLVRIGLGVVLFFIGLNKFLGPDFPSIRWFPYEYLIPQFEQTWLPRPLLVVYGYCLPYAEVLLGVLLIVGVARGPVLFVTGLMFLTLTFGKVLLKDWEGVYENFTYLFFSAVLLFVGEYDRWACCSGLSRTTSDQAPEGS